MKKENYIPPACKRVDILLEGVLCVMSPAAFEPGDDLVIGAVELDPSTP